ncbi:spn-E [Symbiodinium sp. CCMP2456]|nr:spn-E [Symbiodinium sp. CCMP2456]
MPEVARKGRRSATPCLDTCLPSLVGQNWSRIFDTMKRCQVTILVAPTGSGKSTDLPQLLLAEFQKSCPATKILCAQPRRIAATTLAAYVAQRTKTNLGDLVGFEIGGCKVRSQNTRLTYVVAGIALLNCLDSCPDFDVIIVDKAPIKS